jgi:hypothetical protein
VQKKTIIFGGLIILALAAIPFFIKIPKTVKKDLNLEAAKDNKEELQCKALTASGKRCRRQPLPDSDYCWQHKS